MLCCIIHNLQVLHHLPGMFVGVQALPSAGWLVQEGRIQFEDIEEASRVLTNVILDGIGVCVLGKPWFSILRTVSVLEFEAFQILWHVADDYTGQ